jgi:hypothetical protein
MRAACWKRFQTTLGHRPILGPHCNLPGWINEGMRSTYSPLARTSLLRGQHHSGQNVCKACTLTFTRVRIMARTRPPPQREPRRRRVLPQCPVSQPTQFRKTGHALNQLTQLFSDRSARISQMVVFRQSESHAVTAPPLLMNVLNIWNAVSLTAKTSVRLCQKAGESGSLGESPTRGPYVSRAL